MLDMVPRIATPSAEPLMTKTSNRRRNSRFFIGAKNGTSVLSVVLSSMLRVGRVNDGARPTSQSRK